MLATLAAGPLALWMAGCPAADQTCEADAECGADGQCEASGYCSFADETCDTGRRYGEQAPSGRSGECVLSKGTTTGAVPPPPDESGSGETGSQPTTASVNDTGTSTGGDGCTVVTVEETLLSHGNGIYTGIVTPSLADAVLVDFLELSFNTHVAGTFTLGESDWGSLVSCPHCVSVFEDGDREFFAVEGEFTVATGSAPLDGRFQAQLSGVVLQEAELDRDTNATVIIEDGDCLVLSDVNVSALQIPGWRCASGFYEDGDLCDCGCGIPDPDCENELAESCDFCETPGSCSLGQGTCPAAIDPADNSTCDLTLWTCNPDAFNAGDDVCDCGCGLIDPDCSGSTVDACTVCTNNGSCAAGQECIGYIDPFNSGQCGMHPGWTCIESFYGTNDGCDCGCGIEDPDCMEMGIDACEFCDNFGSCSEDPCPLNIDPKDPTQCLPE